MRGISYRLGRRRVGSVLLVAGAALMFGPGSGAAAQARGPAQRAHGLAPVPGHTRVVSVGHASPGSFAEAHAAGHKIA